MRCSAPSSPSLRNGSASRFWRASGVVPAQPFERRQMLGQLQGRIDHGRLGPGMSIEVLDVGHVGVGAAETGGERVPDLVGGERRPTGLVCRCGECPIDAAAGPRPEGFGVEEGAGGGDPFRHEQDGRDPAALPARDGDVGDRLIEPEVLGAEPSHLRRPHPGPVHQIQPDAGDRADGICASTSAMLRRSTQRGLAGGGAKRTIVRSHRAAPKDMTAEIGGVRTEVRPEIGGVRTELGGQIAEVRTEIGGVRTELSGQIETFRTEMNRRFDEAGLEANRGSTCLGTTSQTCGNALPGLKGAVERVPRHATTVWHEGGTRLRRRRQRHLHSVGGVSGAAFLCRGATPVLFRRQGSRSSTRISRPGRASGAMRSPAGCWLTVR